MSHHLLSGGRPVLPFVIATLATSLTLGVATAAFAAAPAAVPAAAPKALPAAVPAHRHVVTAPSLLPPIAPTSLPKLAPTRQAARAGVTGGSAFMGWKERASEKTATSAAASAAAAKGVNGIDVSRWQGTVNWSYWKAHRKTFAYVKATEATSYRNRYFSSQYRGSAKVGLKRGAYHFAIPNRGSGSAQASYFVAHGGSWSRDGHTLPGVLDIEYNPYGSTCYGLSDAKMVSWIKSFTHRYRALTGRDAVIYTTADWWRHCTGNSGAFHRTNPLWIARYSSSVGRLPGGWNFYTFWQYSSRPLDQDRFSGARRRLTALANG